MVERGWLRWRGEHRRKERGWARYNGMEGDEVGESGEGRRVCEMEWVDEIEWNRGDGGETWRG